MRYLNHKDLDGDNHIIKLISTFYFEEHFCLTLELQKSNLLEEYTNRKLNILKKNNQNLYFIPS